MYMVALKFLHLKMGEKLGKVTLVVVYSYLN